MKFFIIHGAYGKPDENWFPWLKKKLEEQGHEVYLPEFPTPKNQTLENWMEVFEEYLPKVDEETIFVGHSLAPAFILSILEKLNVQVRASFFVSGFIGLLGNNTFDEINESFVTKDFDWNRIKENCRKFYTYHSDNDPYVPLEKGKELEERLGAKFTLVEDAGHFNEKAGYTEFYRLLADIIREICSELSVLKEDERGKIFDSGNVKIIMRKKGTVSGKHSHPVGESGKDPEVLELVEGEVESVIGEEKKVVKVPFTFKIPANAYHEFTALTDIILLEHK